MVEELMRIGHHFKNKYNDEDAYYFTYLASTKLKDTYTHEQKISYIFTRVDGYLKDKHKPEWRNKSYRHQEPLIHEPTTIDSIFIDDYVLRPIDRQIVELLKKDYTHSEIRAKLGIPVSSYWTLNIKRIKEVFK